ncbi:hypothetical protein K438DRAFT_1936051 [Mycena galopus ATCC 62051]|nr:hypothetical protein K438DRAFT_1936051 [Mycena galopus ATCC 62051]
MSLHSAWEARTMPCQWRQASIKLASGGPDPATGLSLGEICQDPNEKPGWKGRDWGNGIALRPEPYHMLVKSGELLNNDISSGVVPYTLSGFQINYGTLRRHRGTEGVYNMSDSDVALDRIIRSQTPLRSNPGLPPNRSPIGIARPAVQKTESLLQPIWSAANKSIGYLLSQIKYVAKFTMVRFIFIDLQKKIGLGQYWVSGQKNSSKASQKIATFDTYEGGNSVGPQIDLRAGVNGRRTPEIMGFKNRFTNYQQADFLFRAEIITLDQLD